MSINFRIFIHFSMTTSAIYYRFLKTQQQQQQQQHNIIEKFKKKTKNHQTNLNRGNKKMCGLRENVKKIDDDCFPGTFIQNEKWRKKANISCIKKNPKQKKQNRHHLFIVWKTKNKQKKINSSLRLRLMILSSWAFKKKKKIFSRRRSSTTISPSTPPLILHIPLFCLLGHIKDAAHLAAYENPLVKIILHI